MLCQGRVKLSACSRDGKVIILRIAEAGEVLGSSAMVSDSIYGETAETLEQCRVSIVRKADFLRFLQKNSEACFSAAKQLGYASQSAYSQIRLFGLSNSVGERLAKLFLEWCERSSENSRNIHLKISFTHEEIAGMIGTSRQTVSRLLKDFKDKKLITVKGADLIIHDRKRLEAMIDAPNNSVN